MADAPTGDLSPCVPNQPLPPDSCLRKRAAELFKCSVSIVTSDSSLPKIIPHFPPAPVDAKTFPVRHHIVPGTLPMLTARANRLTMQRYPKRTAELHRYTPFLPGYRR